MFIGVRDLIESCGYTSSNESEGICCYTREIAVESLSWGSLGIIFV